MSSCALDLSSCSAKVVAIVHILLTVGVLSTIISEIEKARALRRKNIERLHLMMRKSDPSLLEQLSTSYQVIASECI